MSMFFFNLYVKKYSCFVFKSCCATHSDVCFLSKVSGKTFEVESTFHRYVRPVRHPLLSVFCTELTGITQDAVAGEDAFEKVFSDFNAWLAAEAVIGSRFTFVTCGDWDLKTMLPNQCVDVGVSLPGYFGRWINLKVSNQSDD